MKNTAALLFALGLFVVHAHAHLCLLYPHQRGPLGNLNIAGAPDCLRLDSPCGGQVKNTSNGIPTFYAGAYVEIAFQKNKDHYNRENPGNWYINIGRDDGEGRPEEFERLYYFRDSPPFNYETGQSLYAFSVKMPSYPMDSAILQVVYETNNEEAPPDFYQCADIRLIET